MVFYKLMKFLIKVVFISNFCNYQQYFLGMQKMKQKTNQWMRNSDGTPHYVLDIY